MSFSQTTSIGINQDSTVSITYKQLRYTNLIFAEHNKLLTENNLLFHQLKNYEDEITLFEKRDSLRVNQINEYKSLNILQEQQIKDLNKSISNKDKTLLGLKIGCITFSIGIVLLLICLNDN